MRKLRLRYGLIGTLQTMSALTMDSQEPTDDFSLVLGGPLFQILRRAYLSGSALELARRRVIVITTLSWLPLLGALSLGRPRLGQQCWFVLYT
jgi:hypothetical protein